MEDRRTDTRVQPRARVRVRLAVKGALRPEVHGWTRNISVSGVYVETDGRIPIGSTCLFSGLADLQGTLLKVRGEARIVRHDETGMGIQYTKVPPEAEDAIRRLVEHHLE